MDNSKWTLGIRANFAEFVRDLKNTDDVAEYLHSQTTPELIRYDELDTISRYPLEQKKVRKLMELLVARGGNAVVELYNAFVQTKNLHLAKRMTMYVQEYEKANVNIPEKMNPEWPPSLEELEKMDKDPVRKCNIKSPSLVEPYSNKYVYKMKSRIRGRAIIINNEEFINTKLNRDGSFRDRNGLKIVLEQLHFKVRVENNLTAEACPSGHQAYRWCSQPVLSKGLHGGDILSAAALLASGNNYAKVALFAKFLKLHFLSSTSFDRLQAAYLVPQIDAFWKKKQDDILAEFKDKELVILGDGRMDSPGHSAQYCSYTIMENDSKKILSVVTLDKREADKKSTNLELLGFNRTMQTMKEKNMNVVEVVTDAHLQIGALMKKDYKAVKHSHDIWHAAKNLGKKIISAGQDKECRQLQKWSKHIVNHFWHVCQKASTKDEFTGMWCSLLHHVVDEHEWVLPYCTPGTYKCDHGPLEDDAEKEWLVRDGPAHSALRKIIMDKRFLNKIPYFLNFRSTAELENFQQHILMYAAKRFAYSPPVYQARNQLAALDYNANVERPFKENEDGSEIERLVEEESKHPDHAVADCFIFVVLSHGNRNGILGIDEKDVPISKLTDPFDSSNCPSLEGKPRVFIFQACRGKQEQQTSVVGGDGARSDDAEDIEDVSEAIDKVQSEARGTDPKIEKVGCQKFSKTDFIIAYATAAGFKAYRSTRRGSWFIQALIRLLKYESHEEHLADILTQVNNHVSMGKADRARTVSNYETSLTQKLYFFPGVWDDPPKINQ